MLTEKGRSCVETAIKETGLNYQIEKRQLSCNGRLVEKWGLFRGDRLLSIVSENYKLIQNTDVFTLFDPYVASGNMEVVSAGHGASGRNAWMLFGTEEEESLGGDNIKAQVLARTSHGKGALLIGLCPYRFFCSNSLAAAVRDGAYMRIAHVGSFRERFSQVGDFLKSLPESFRDQARAYRLLNERILTQDLLEKFDQRMQVSEKQKSTRWYNMGTLWHLYNWYNGMIQHNDKVDVSRRMNSLFFGHRDRRALRVCLELVA